MTSVGATVLLVDPIDLLNAEDLTSPGSTQLKEDLVDLEAQSRFLMLSA